MPKAYFKILISSILLSTVLLACNTAGTTPSEPDPQPTPDPTVTLTHEVLEDVNADNLKDENDTPIAGVSVTLLAEDGSNIAVKSTNEDGTVSFETTAKNTSFLVQATAAMIEQGQGLACNTTANLSLCSTAAIVSLDKKLAPIDILPAYKDLEFTVSNTEFCINAPKGSETDGATIRQNYCLAGQTQQLWKLEAINDLFRITSAQGNKVLASTANDTVIQTSLVDDDNNQLWKLTKTAKGTELLSVSSGKCLTSAATSNTAVTLTSCESSDAQSFALKLNKDFGSLSRKHYTYLTQSIGQRPSGSEQEEAAATYAKEQFELMGYTVELQTFRTKDDTFEIFSQNVIAKKQGSSDKQIIIGAHIDSAGDDEIDPEATNVSEGAADNASGSSLLLEVAENIATIDTPYTLVFILFGAEETGREGSTFYANNMTETEIANTVNMINLDAVSVGDFNYVYGDEGERGFIRDWALTRAESLNISLITQDGKKKGATNSDESNGYTAGTTGDWSDHVSFKILEIPYTYFEATNWNTVKMNGDEEAYTGEIPLADKSIGKEGEIWDTEFDNLAYIDSVLPGHVDAHFNAFSITLFDILSNSLPIEKAAPVEPVPPTELQLNTTHR